MSPRLHEPSAPMSPPTAVMTCKRARLLANPSNASFQDAPAREPSEDASSPVLKRRPSLINVLTETHLKILKCLPRSHLVPLPRKPRACRHFVLSTKMIPFFPLRGDMVTW
ncbi:hypothetical protein B2J93_7942 [Marssonina coronariae]|uniref:Uncharacterized protein n=1 Tax=Diplocarpon coronariae TaxID=2795749 RepID=A0A218Z8K0_9HELO|nr:hypothetical protein B2J93_7942 [Marssonina coronariae]